MKKIIFALLLLVSLLPGIGQAAPAVNALNTIYMNGIPMIAINRPQWTDSVVLAANTAGSYTFPSGALYVLFSANSDFYVNFVTTAIVPVAATTNGAAPLLNPGNLYKIDNATAVSIICPAACVVTLSSYK